MRAPGVAPPPGRNDLGAWARGAWSQSAWDQSAWDQSAWDQSAWKRRACLLRNFRNRLRRRRALEGGKCFARWRFARRRARPANPIPAWSSGWLASRAWGKSANGANGTEQAETAKCNPDVRQFAKRRTLSNRELPQGRVPIVVCRVHRYPARAPVRTGARFTDIRPAAEGHAAAPVRQEPEAVRRTPRSAAYIPGRAGQNRSMAH